MNDFEIIKRTVNLLDVFGKLYSHHSVGRTDNYLVYVGLAKGVKKADEKTLIQPILFPAFLEEILDFSKIDYIPEQRNENRMAPDFTPIDTLLHPFIFETKGNDSDLEDFEKEFHNKSKLYLSADLHAKYVIITNMDKLVVYEKDSEKKIEDYSFSFTRLYEDFKKKVPFDLKDENSQSFIRFVKRFHKSELTMEKKIETIASAEPYPPLFGVVTEERVFAEEHETLKLTNAIRFIVDTLKDDVKNNRGKEYVLKALRNDTLRKEQIAREIYSICQSLDSKYPVPESEKIEAKELDLLLDSSNKTIKKSVDLYFYRVAYFTMSRLLLIRVWEDAQFIEREYVTLFNGGFKKWYQAYNKKIVKVLEQAYNIGKGKYEWLFTDQNNYAWYLPTDKVLVDVLYELAKYNLSIVNRDVLGTVYEEYLDVQDKKSKGQYFTPHQIVSLIWDRVGYTSIKYGDEKSFFDFKNGKRIPKLIFEPATGSGSFLVEAIYRLRNHFQLLNRDNRLNVRDALDVRDAIIKGMNGSEISAFSYYLTEVNILIQLTPIIQKIIDLNSIERELSGKFTLRVIHQDSLGLHNPPERAFGESAEKEFVIDKDHDILKLEGEKLQIFKYIKDNHDFDYAIANPPYIGEDEHKELFRNATKRYPYWKKYYQGKMDYLYFFVILALQKLKENGKLGFITTSYWLTADGASNLRKFILDNAKIVEIIDFGEIKLFEHAKGQHNIVFVLKRCRDEKKKKQKEQNKIKLVKVKEHFDGKNVSDRLTKLVNHIKKHIDKEDYSDQYIEVFYSAVKQGELTDKAWYIFYRERVAKILNQIESIGKELIKFCDINQGLITNPMTVDKSVLETLTTKEIEENNISKGDGLFVLSAAEIKNIDISEKEGELLKPFFFPSDIKRFYVSSSTDYKVIYTNKHTNIEEYPNIKIHLEKFKKRLYSRRECEEGKIPWYSLHWPREQEIFESEKIICPYRSDRNMFGYTEKPFYAEGSVRFITPKKDEKNKLKFTNSENLSKHDLRYILGVLNSSLFRVWCHHKTKPKGDMRELFYTPLTQMPIKPIDFDNSEEMKMYENIIEYAQTIIDLKRELSTYQKYFQESILELETSEPLPKILNETILHALSESKKRDIWTSSQLKPTDSDKDFILKRANEVTINMDRGITDFEYMLILEGKNKGIIKIDGEKEILTFLKIILDENYEGMSWKEIEQNIILPDTMESFEIKYIEIRDKVHEILKKIQKSQDEINEMVCKLYGIKTEDVNDAIEQSF
ncbi:MAG: N-6 DNA methylase [Methanocellales archaeon]|nr:N-6 DNA methylase [Methanocellales archaeon]MDD3291914.1 N-6 DNA methylase [Methanocellales archaeon]MDD5235775.1 N-6 DNA methylase [Methanocellales archaeon]MDD5485532.1 N-6 DNA methylase [Methanocellales archaeon]